MTQVFEQWVQKTIHVLEQKKLSYRIKSDRLVVGYADSKGSGFWGPVVLMFPAYLIRYVSLLAVPSKQADDQIVLIRDQLQKKILGHSLLQCQIEYVSQMDQPGGEIYWNYEILIQGLSFEKMFSMVEELLNFQA